MWTHSKTDRMILHAEMETMAAFNRFLSAYFHDRMPGPLEIASILQIPPELVMEAVAFTQANEELENG